MDILNKASTKACSLSSFTIRKILNLIENCHNKSYQLLNTFNYVPSHYISKIVSFEQQLKTYSPFTLIVFGIFLYCYFFFSKNVVNF